MVLWQHRRLSFIREIHEWKGCELLPEGAAKEAQTQQVGIPHQSLGLGYQHLHLENDFPILPLTCTSKTPISSFFYDWWNTRTLQLWISAGIDNTKHCQIPPDWHWAFSHNTGIKTSVLYVSNWLSPLKIQFCSVLDKIIPWLGRSALFVGVHNFLWSPLFVSIMLPTQMAVVNNF